MAERTNIPSSPECGLWETQLADALDGLLRPEEEAIFQAHMATCAACTALYEESSRGRQWLEFLSPEPEVPMDLLEKILAQTGPGQVAGYGVVPGATDVLPMPQPWQQPGFMAQVRRYAEPRLLMTAAMAFFSIALTLNLTNVRLSGLRLSDLRPTSVRSFMERRITMASTPIVRYYDHLRFVYEVETRMRELRRTSENDTASPQQKTPQPGESKHDPTRKDGGSRVDPPQQSVTPAPNDSEMMEVSLTFPVSEKNGFRIGCFKKDDFAVTGSTQHRSALPSGSALDVRERSKPWTA
jgi:hypothetical protein